MATITIENVPDSVVKQYGTKIDFSYDFSFDDTPIDFYELDASEITPEILQSIENAKKLPKSALHNI